MTGQGGLPIQEVVGGQQTSAVANIEVLTVGHIHQWRRFGVHQPQQRVGDPTLSTAWVNWQLAQDL